MEVLLPEWVVAALVVLQVRVLRDKVLPHKVPGLRVRLLQLQDKLLLRVPTEPPEVLPEEWLLSGTVLAA
jgi:hypothetical protein